MSECSRPSEEILHRNRNTLNVLGSEAMSADALVVSTNPPSLYSLDAGKLRLRRNRAGDAGRRDAPSMETSSAQRTSILRLVPSKNGQAGLLDPLQIATFTLFPPGCAVLRLDFTHSLPLPTHSLPHQSPISHAGNRAHLEWNVGARQQRLILMLRPPSWLARQTLKVQPILMNTTTIMDPPQQMACQSIKH